MKVITLLVISSLSISVSFAQKLHNKFYSRQIDSIKVFSPLGNIATSTNNAIVPNVTLSQNFIPKFEKSFEKVAPFKVSFVENTAITDMNHQKYFIKLMERVQHLDNKTFSKVKIGKNITELIKTESGRFFCFVLYSGLDGKEIESGSDLTSSLSGAPSNESRSSLYYPLATEQPFLKNFLLIVDKSTGELIYFNENKISESPLKTETMEAQIKVLLTSYLQK